MTYDELEERAANAFGAMAGLQGRLAKLFDVRPRAIRRWAEMNEIPDWAVEKFTNFEAAHESVKRGRDEWIIGNGFDDEGYNREYIFHTAEPRFYGRVVLVDGDGNPVSDEGETDILAGHTFKFSDTHWLCEVIWIDEPDDVEAILAVFEAAKAEYLNATE